MSDSLAAIKAVTGLKPRVTLRPVIESIRLLCHDKALRLQHVPGHVGVAGNEIADKHAKYACATLPPPPSPTPRYCSEVVAQGELVTPPHKTWTRGLIPHHTPDGIHSISWRKYHSGAWFRWLQGLQQAPGYEDARSFWRAQASRRPCHHCGTCHNQSVHRHLAFCTSFSNPLLQAWFKPWAVHRHLVSQWRHNASHRDRMLTGKLAVPTTLMYTLQHHLGHKRARLAVLAWQRHVITELRGLLPRFHAGKGHPRRRPSPWEEDDWLPATRRRLPPLTLPTPKRARPHQQPMPANVPPHPHHSLRPPPPHTQQRAHPHLPHIGPSRHPPRPEPTDASLAREQPPPVPLTASAR